VLLDVVLVELPEFLPVVLPKILLVVL